MKKRLLMSWLGGVNLIKAMVTGVKPMPQQDAGQVVPEFGARKRHAHTGG